MLFSFIPPYLQTRTPGKRRSQTRNSDLCLAPGQESGRYGADAAKSSERYSKWGVIWGYIADIPKLEDLAQDLGGGVTA